MQLNNALMMGTVVEVADPSHMRIEILQRNRQRERTYKGQFAVALENPEEKVKEGNLISISGQLVGRTREADPHILAKTVTRHSGSLDTQINRVVLVGIGSDLNYHSLRRGTSRLARLNLTVQYGYATNGHWQAIPTKMPLILWGALADAATKHVQQPCEIGVVGYLTNGTKSNGEGRWEIEVVAEQVRF